MSLIPFEPFRQLDNMGKELNQFFTSNLGFNQNFGVPSVDVYETEKEVVATVDVPGLEKKDDVTIKIENDKVLSISGTINRAKEIKGEHMHKQERFTGRFPRSISLPVHVSVEEEAKATYKNGVLEIRMLKSNDQDAGQKKIDVEFH